MKESIKKEINLCYSELLSKAVANRKCSGYSLRDLEKETGVAESLLCRFENGKNKSVKLLIIYALKGFIPGVFEWQKR